jgi:hypothetical protein
MTQQQPAGAVEPAAPAPLPQAPPQTDPVIVQELQRLNAQNQYLANTVGQIGQWAQNQEAQRLEYARRVEEARIASLPPQDQGAEIAKLARAENAQLRQYIAQSQQAAAQAQQQRQAAPQVPDRNSVQLTPQQIEAKKQALVAQVNETYGLTGDQAVTPADIPARFHTDQELFATCAEELGEQRRGTPSTEGSMAKKAGTSKPAAHRPFSPSAIPAARLPDKGDFAAVLGNAHRGLSEKVVTPGQRGEALRQLREKAAAKLG